jgi:hypothetical protein
MVKKIPVVWILVIIAIFSAMLITVFDAGGSVTGGSGAGDIWWVDVPEVEQSYRTIMQDR